MIDYASFKIKNFSNSEFQKLVNGANIYCPINGNHVYFDLYNLRIDYFPNDNTLRIRNSVHKFYTALFGKVSCNSNDFYFENMKAVADILSIIYFDRDIKDFELSTKLEVGVNISIDKFSYKPFEVIERYLSFQSGSSVNAFITCDPNKGKPIMRKCRLSDYYIKFYDKTKLSLAKIGHTVRYEVVFEQLRKIRAVLEEQDLSLQTLCEYENWWKFGRFLSAVYRAISKVPLIEAKNMMSIEDLNKVYAHCNHMYKSDLKSTLTFSSYNKNRLENQNVYQYWNSHEENVHLLIGEKIDKKIINLIHFIACKKL